MSMVVVKWEWTFFSEPPLLCGTAIPTLFQMKKIVRTPSVSSVNSSPLYFRLSLKYIGQERQVQSFSLFRVVIT